MTTLPYIAIPRQDESFVSVIFRLAYLNGYSTIDSFFHAFHLGNGGIVLSQWTGSALYKLLMQQSTLSKEDKGSLHSIFKKKIIRSRIDSFLLNGMTMPTQMLRQSLVLCPSCVRAGLLGHMHSYEFCNVCPHHSEFFIERCPSCGSPFDWRKIQNWACPCGQDLRKLETQSTDIYSTNLVVQSLRKADTVYFKNLCCAIKATRFLITPHKTHTTLIDCQNIATGDKEYFFNYARRQQELYPCLHRRAILAPWVTLENSLLRTNAIEYFFAASQKRPPRHRPDCSCDKLLFDTAELEFILNTRKPTTNNTKIKIAYAPKTGRLYEASGLCDLLISSNTIIWEKENSSPFPCDANRLINAAEVADILSVRKETVHRLHSFGLLKGERFSRKVGILIKASEVEEFRKTYLLNREISKNLGIRPRTVHTMLNSAGIPDIKHSAFGASLIAYRKDEFPKDLLVFLTSQRAPAQPGKTINSTRGVIFGTTAKKLRIDLKDVPALIELGILHTIKTTRKSGVPGRELCSRESLCQALRWRNCHPSFAEVAKHSGCSTRILHSRYVSSQFIREIKLNVTSFMSRSDADRVTHHFKLYTSAKSARAEYRLGPQTIKQLISKKMIHPLHHTHKDYLKGQTTILRVELNKIYSQPK